MASRIEKRRHEVSYRLRLSVRYHQRRTRFFDLWDKWTKAMIVLVGTSAFASIVHQQSDTNFAAWLTAFVAVIGTLSLVFSFSERARVHADMARRYGELEAEIARLPSTQEKALTEIGRRLRLIESTEPATLGALVVMCQNEIARQEGHEDKIVEVPLYQRLLAHYLDFPAPSP